MPELNLHTQPGLIWANEKSAIPPKEIERANAVSNLKQLKELLDAKIITKTEFLLIKKKYIDKL